MGFESFEEIIAYAIEKEIEAAAFYDECSRQEVFSGNRELFADFAKEERKHQALLENVRDDQQKLSRYDFKWIPDMKRSDYLVDLEYEKGMHYVDILRLAMKREEKALQLYNDLARRSDAAEHVKLFQMLSQEEAKHKQKLETLYDDYMAAQGD